MIAAARFPTTPEPSGSQVLGALSVRPVCPHFAPGAPLVLRTAEGKLNQGSSAVRRRRPPQAILPHNSTRPVVAWQTGQKGGSHLAGRHVEVCVASFYEVRNLFLSAFPGVAHVNADHGITAVREFQKPDRHTAARSGCTYQCAWKTSGEKSPEYFNRIHTLLR